MEIDLELTEKSAKNTQRWWKLTSIVVGFRGLMIEDHVTVVMKWNEMKWIGL